MDDNTLELLKTKYGITKLLKIKECQVDCEKGVKGIKGEKGEAGNNNYSTGN